MPPPTGGDETLHFQPGPDQELLEGDHVIALGDRDNLSRFAALARGKNEAGG